MKNPLARTLIVVAVMVLLSGVASPAAQEVPAEKATKSVSIYRVDFAIHESEDGKRINTRNYSQLVEEGGWGRIRAGASVPITTEKGVQYTDVGINLDCELKERNGHVRLDLRLEISSFGQEQEGKDRPLLRRIRSDVQTVIPVGKSTVVSSIDDTASKRRYELEVTATKVK